MPKRGVNIHKRKDGRWEARYQKGRKPDGKLIYGSVYGTSYKEAKEKLLFASTHVVKEPVPRTHEHTFKEILLMWLEHNRIRCKGSTCNKYQYMIETHIIPQLGNVKMSVINATMINAFLTEKLTCGRLDHCGGLSPAYVRSIMLIINGAIKFAVSEELCAPMKTQIFRPAEPKQELPILSKDAQKRLESRLLAEPDPTSIGILLSLYTGIRIGEVCALTWNDVDLGNHIIHIRHTISRIKNPNDSEIGKSILIVDTPKTKASTRDIPISSVLYPVLSESAAKTPNHYVVSDSVEFLSPRTYEYRYHRMLHECGIESINYHALRHTFATRCIEAGVDVKSLSEILGHANVGITLGTYVHSSMDLKRTQLEKLASFTA